MDELATWSCTPFSADGETRDVFRRGSGPGVIVIHEIPGIEANLVRFADEVVARGHTVWLPRLFGEVGKGFTVGNVVGDIARFCVRREFSILARGRTSPIALWLRALARALHEEAGGPGVGVVGMCFTGGFALAMMTDAPVIAPVLAEPSLPAAVGLPRAARARGADLGLSPADLRVVRESPHDVLGLCYRSDPAVGTRFDTLRRELGDRFLAVEFDGGRHSTLTNDRQEEGVRRVLDFLDSRLAATSFER